MIPLMLAFIVIGILVSIFACAILKMMPDSMAGLIVAGLILCISASIALMGLAGLMIAVAIQITGGTITP